MATNTRYNIFNILAIILISAGFIIITFRKVDLHVLIDGITQLNGWWLLCGCAAIVIAWLLESTVLYTMVHSHNRQNRFLSSLKVTMVGQLFNVITPLATGGQQPSSICSSKGGWMLG